MSERVGTCCCIASHHRPHGPPSRGILHAQHPITERCVGWMTSTCFAGGGGDGGGATDGETQQGKTIQEVASRWRVGWE